MAKNGYEMHEVCPHAKSRFAQRADNTIKLQEFLIDVLLTREKMLPALGRRAGYTHAELAKLDGSKTHAAKVVIENAPAEG